MHTVLVASTTTAVVIGIKTRSVGPRIENKAPLNICLHPLPSERRIRYDHDNLTLRSCFPSYKFVFLVRCTDAVPPFPSPLSAVLLLLLLLLWPLGWVMERIAWVCAAGRRQKKKCAGFVCFGGADIDQYDLSATTFSPDGKIFQVRNEQEDNGRVSGEREGRETRDLWKSGKHRTSTYNTGAQNIQSPNTFCER